VQIAWHDGNADMRCVVLPARSSGIEAMSESDLAELVARDGMIGVAVVKPTAVM
jgi:nitrile hydratase